eukprot:gene12687-6581_t
MVIEKETDLCLLRFSSVFLNKEISTQFENHLKHEYNLEPWVFLQQLELYHSIKDIEQKISEFFKMYENFIENNSQQELNISAKMKKPLTSVYETLKHSKEFQLNNDDLESMDEIFNDVSRSITDELFYDSFPRFVRTKECLKFIENHKHDSTLVTPLIVSAFNYNDNYFKNGLIDDTDFDYFKTLYEDNPLWELLGSKNGTNVFYSNFNYLPDVKDVKIRCIKYESIIPYSLEQAGLFVLSDRMIEKFDPNIKKITVMNYIQENELKKKLKKENLRYRRNLALLEYDINFGFPFDARKMKLGASTTYHKEEKMIQSITKSYIDENESWSTPKVQKFEKNNKTKSMKAFSAFGYYGTFLKEVDENKTMLTQILNLNLGGWMKNDEKILKFLVKERGKSLRKDFSKIKVAVPKDARISDYDEINGLVQNGHSKLLFDTDISKIKKDDKKFELKQRRKRAGASCRTNITE